MKHIIEIMYSFIAANINEHMFNISLVKEDKMFSISNLSNNGKHT